MEGSYGKGWDRNPTYRSLRQVFVDGVIVFGRVFVDCHLWFPTDRYSWLHDFGSLVPIPIWCPSSNNNFPHIVRLQDLPNVKLRAAGSMFGVPRGWDLHID